MELYNRRDQDYLTLGYSVYTSALDGNALLKGLAEIGGSQELPGGRNETASGPSSSEGGTSSLGPTRLRGRGREGSSLMTLSTGTEVRRGVRAAVYQILFTDQKTQIWGSAQALSI